MHDAIAAAIPERNPRCQQVCQVAESLNTRLFEFRPVKNQFTSERRCPHSNGYLVSKSGFLNELKG